MQLAHGPSRSNPIASPSLPMRTPHTTAPLPPLLSPTASSWSHSRGKRLFDLVFALAVLAVCAAPMLLIALSIRLTSPGPALFAQRRVGRAGRRFSVYKFRSMKFNPGAAGSGLTRKDDSRVTALGRWLRRLKLDELPQFLNVLRGEMSIVGPRPKLPQFAGIADMPYRPGITGAATLAFRREEEILGRIHPAHMEDFYHRHIKPLKARIDARYMGRATLWSDLGIVASTFFACIAPPREPVLPRAPSAFSPAPGLHPLPTVESAASDSLGQSN
jgi:lipopolysaccharide/colanic/teichoic acid biosynthesis glycosyltransferase